MSKRPRKSKADTPKITPQHYEVTPLSALTPHPMNANEGDIGAVYDSQQANGFYGVLYAQKSTGYILAGHTRFYAAQKHGFKELPVIFLDVDDVQARKILAVDNRARDLAKYDEAALQELLDSIWQDSGTLAGTGFDDSKFTELLERLETPPNGVMQDAQHSAKTPPNGVMQDESENDEHSAGRRLSFSPLQPSDAATVDTAIKAAIDAAGGRMAAKGGGYSPQTHALLEICTAYIDARGLKVGKT